MLVFQMGKRVVFGQHDACLRNDDILAINKRVPNHLLSRGLVPALPLQARLTLLFGSEHEEIA
jgi:hypothetical protein